MLYRHRRAATETAVELAGRRVLVTGGSRGIGAALARGLHTAGAELALLARSAGPLRETAQSVGGTAYPADLGDLEDVPRLVDRIEADGAVDVLVNNAGVSNVGWFLDRTHEELRDVVTVNLLAPMLLCRELLPRMVARGRGHVVNMSSMAAVFAPPGLAAYGASKAGLSHLTAGLRADLRDHPVTFTAVHLASVHTEMDDEARSYGPLRELAARSHGRDITAMEDVVAATIDGIVRERAEVRLPRAMAPLAAITSLPRRLGRLLFRRASAYEPRGDDGPEDDG